MSAASKTTLPQAQLDQLAINTIGIIRAIRNGTIGTVSSCRPATVRRCSTACCISPVLMREYGFTVENVCKRALALLEKNNA